MEFKESVQRDQKHLQTVRDQVNRFCEECRMPEHLTPVIEISIDEIMANIMEHSTGTQPLEYCLSLVDGVFQCRIFADGPPLDLMKFIGKFSIDDYIEKRKQRGLGLHIVNKFMDEFSVENQNGKNIFILTKNTKPKDAGNA